MAENLNFYLDEGCWFFDNDPKNGKKYGRLYNWEAANEACPPGWRLPSNLEWFELVRNFNGKESQPEKNSRMAFQALTSGGNSRFVPATSQH